MSGKIYPIRQGIEINPNPEVANNFPQPVKFQLVIEASMIGGMVTDLNVHGPIFNKILCFGLLSGAHDVIREYVPSPSNVLAPDPGPGKIITP